MKFVEDKMLAASQLPKRTIALVLAGGRGTRLHQLTDNRAGTGVRHFSATILAAIK